jgi:hypothetical protein
VWIFRAFLWIRYGSHKWEETYSSQIINECDMTGSPPLPTGRQARTLKMNNPPLPLFRKGGSGRFEGSFLGSHSVINLS